EFGGRWWLPTYERVDVQARSALSETFRPGLRVVTRFHDHAIDSLATTAAVDDDQSHGAGDRGRLTFAPNDSLDAFAGWRAELGAATSAVTAADFDDAARANAPRDVPNARPTLE